MHLTNDDIARFRARQLPADALVAFTEHLAACAECRARTAATAPAAIAEQALDEALGLASDAHVDELSIHAFVNGTLDAAARAAVETHLADCERCTAEVDDLRAFATTAAPAAGRHTWRYALAAAAVLLIGVLATLMWRTPAPVQLVSLVDAGGQVTLDSEGRVSGVGPLAPETQALVRNALSTGTLVIPASVMGLTGTPGALRGATEAPTFHLLAPLGTAVLSGQPTLAWTAAAGATHYIVTLQHEGSGRITSSPAVNATTWTPPEALEQGATYTWQVAAVVGGVEQVAPVPPAPPARFNVVSAEDVRRLAVLPPSHLVRGVAYAGAGLLDDAAREFAVLTATNPESAIAVRLSAQVRQARP